MINVIKATGEREPFDKNKLISSIKRAGIPQKYHSELVSDIESRLYDNIHTSKIYSFITEFFKKNYSFGRARYSLKQALMELGPTGYPFEDYIADILEHQGYKTKTRAIISGKCIDHEIDIIAIRENKKIIIEAKFHNAAGTKTDNHVAMYTKARFDDICKREKYDEAWIATNTKVTQDALAYAMCSNMKVISWSYPSGESLRELIEKSKLFPITALTTLSNLQKQQLMQQHIIMCKELVEKPAVLNNIVQHKHKIERILEEARNTCLL